MIFLRATGKDIQLPTRATEGSAGYDFYMPFEVELLPDMELSFSTDVIAELDEDKVMFLLPRSSLGRQGLVFMNTVSVIDSDYHEPIKVFLRNEGPTKIKLKKGDRFMQGIILDYYKVSNDQPLSKERKGGVGSTGR